MNDVEIYQAMQKSPIYFIKKMWGLSPQPVKNESKERVNYLIHEGRLSEIQADDFDEFIKGRDITWQQWLILLAVEKAITNEAQKKISVVSGHGTGKDACLSWLILWFLFCFKNAQVPCTAPTSELIHDVLWKEIKIWLDRMPKEIAGLYDWTTGYLRIAEARETWFARARTARKEAPEAIAGVHSEYVLIAVDEASGVPEEIYKTAEGSLTGENTLVILISNGTRNEGYFYETHHSDARNWQRLSLNSEESPIVVKEYIERIIEKYGEDSDEYKIRVKGGFPRVEQMDSGGWIPLMDEAQISLVSSDISFTGKKRMGIDPSGEGDNWTKWYVRDNFVAKRVAQEQVSNPKSIAQKTITLIDAFDLQDENIKIDNFGEGANVAKELALSDKRHDIDGVNWGEDAEDKETYLNKRAECYFAAKNWLIGGGGITNEDLKKEFPKIKYKINLGGQRQIMPKKDLIKHLGKSPDDSDAFALTFYGLEEEPDPREEQELIRRRQDNARQAKKEYGL